MEQLTHLGMRLFLLLHLPGLGSAILRQSFTPLPRGNQSGAVELWTEEGPVITRHNHRVDIAKCGEAFTAHPEKASCPDDCPYLRREPTTVCDFKCVKASQCNDDDPMMGYADPETMRCTSCHVPACHKCGDSHRSCAVCQDGYVMRRAPSWTIVQPSTWLNPDTEERWVCKPRHAWMWGLGFVVAGVIIVALLAYVIDLFRRPVVNEEGLRHALRCRASSTLSDKPLRTDLCHKYVSGVGVMLHFRFEMYAICGACLCCLLLLATNWFVGDPPELATASPRSFSVCGRDVQKQMNELHDMEQIYLIANIILYVFGTLGCLYAAARQQLYAKLTSLENTTMQDYSIFLKGLPSATGDKKVEEVLQRHLEEFLAPAGVNIIGVSVCWDYRHCQSVVEDQLEWELKKLDMERDRREDTHAQGRRAANSISPRRSRGRIFYRIDDFVFGIKELTYEEQRALELGEAAEHSPEKVHTALKGMSSTDGAYVVFETERQRDDALAFFEEHTFNLQPLWEELGCTGPSHKPFKADAQESEPGTVMWSNYGIRRRQVILRVVVSLIVLVVAIAILDIIFYFPSVNWLMSHMDVRGHREGGIPLTILGLLVVVCNQAIYAIIDQLADFIRFKSNDTRQRFYVVNYTLAVFINTILDLVVVVLTAQGFTLETAQALDVNADVSMSVQAIAENPAIQNALYYQFVLYTWPSCLLVPFLIEPLLYVGTYLVMTRLVRSRSEIDADQAEGLLQYPPFDLAHYGDVVVNSLLCCTTLLFTQVDLWFIWGALAISVVYITSWDQCRFLRFTRRSIFVSTDLDFTVQKLMAAPCAIALVCVVFRIFSMDLRSQTLFGMSLPHLRNEAERTLVSMGLPASAFPWVAMAGVALAHITVHWFILDTVIPRFNHVELEHDRDKSYATTATEWPRNWFNANPIHVLRSKYFYKHDCPVVFYQSGKEYLLEPNAKLGQYYSAEPPQVDGEDLKSLRESLKSLAVEAANTAKSDIRHVVETVKRHYTSTSSREPSVSTTPAAGSSPSKPAGGAGLL